MKTPFVLAAALLVCVGVMPAAGQSAPRAQSFAAPEPVLARAQASTARAYGIEAAGGIAGSLIGFGAVYIFADDCQDIDCLGNAFAAILAGTTTSALGTILAGHAADTNPSAAGATLGAVAGAAAGIGVWHLLTEELNWVQSSNAGILTYTVTQGLVTALGSRLVRALR